MEDYLIREKDELKRLLKSIIEKYSEYKEFIPNKIEIENDDFNITLLDPEHKDSLYNNPVIDTKFVIKHSSKSNPEFESQTPEFDVYLLSNIVDTFIDKYNSYRIVKRMFVSIYGKLETLRIDNSYYSKSMKEQNKKTLEKKELYSLANNIANNYITLVDKGIIIGNINRTYDTSLYKLIKPKSENKNIIFISELGGHKIAFKGTSNELVAITCGVEYVNELVDFYSYNNAYVFLKAVDEKLELLKTYKLSHSIEYVNHVSTEPCKKDKTDTDDNVNNYDKFINEWIKNYKNHEMANKLFSGRNSNTKIEAGTGKSGGLIDAIKNIKTFEISDKFTSVELDNIITQILTKVNMETKIKRMYHEFTFEGNNGRRTITLCCIDIRNMVGKDLMSRRFKIGYTVLNPKDTYNKELAQKHSYDAANHDPIHYGYVDEFYGKHGIIIKKELEAVEDVITKRGSDIIPGLKRVE